MLSTSRSKLARRPYYRLAQIPRIQKFVRKNKAIKYIKFKTKKQPRILKKLKFLLVLRRFYLRKKLTSTGLKKKAPRYQVVYNYIRRKYRYQRIWKIWKSRRTWLSLFRKRGSNKLNFTNALSNLFSKFTKISIRYAGGLPEYKKIRSESTITLFGPAKHAANVLASRLIAAQDRLARIQRFKKPFPSFASARRYHLIRAYNRYKSNILKEAFKKYYLPKDLKSIETAVWLSTRRNSYIWNNAIGLNKQLKLLKNNTSYSYEKYKKTRGLSLYQKAISRYYFNDGKFFLQRTFRYKNKKLGLFSRKNRRLVRFIKYMGLLSDPRYVYDTHVRNRGILGSDYDQQIQSSVEKYFSLNSYSPGLNEQETSLRLSNKGTVKDSFNSLGDTKYWFAKNRYFNERFTWGFNLIMYGVPYLFYYNICARFFFRSYFGFRSFKKLHNYAKSFRVRTFSVINFIKKSTQRPLLFFLDRNWFTSKYTFQSLYASGNIFWISGKPGSQYIQRFNSWQSVGPTNNYNDRAYCAGDLFAMIPHTRMYNSYKRLVASFYPKSFNNNYFLRVLEPKVLKKLIFKRSTLTDHRFVDNRLLYRLNRNFNKLSRTTSKVKPTLNFLKKKFFFLKNRRTTPSKNRYLKFSLKKKLLKSFLNKKRNLGIQNLDSVKASKVFKTKTCTNALVSLPKWKIRIKKFRNKIYWSKSGQFDNLTVFNAPWMRRKAYRTSGAKARKLIPYYKGSFNIGAISRNALPSFNMSSTFYKNKVINYNLNLSKLHKTTKYIYSMHHVLPFSNKSNLILSAFYPGMRADMLRSLIKCYFTRSSFFKYYFSNKSNVFFGSMGLSRLLDTYLLKTSNAWKLGWEKQSDDLRKLVLSQLTGFSQSAYSSTSNPKVVSSITKAKFNDVSKLVLVNTNRERTLQTVLNYLSFFGKKHFNFFKNNFNITSDFSKILDYESTLNYYKYFSLINRIFLSSSTRVEHGSTPSFFIKKAINELFWQKKINHSFGFGANSTGSAAPQDPYYNFGLQPSDLTYNNKSNRLIFNTGVLYSSKRGFSLDTIKPHIFQTKKWLSSFKLLFPSTTLNLGLPRRFAGDITKKLGDLSFKRPYRVARTGFIRSVRQPSTISQVTNEKLRNLYYQSRLSFVKSSTKLGGYSESSFFFDNSASFSYRLPYFLKKAHYLVNDYYYSNLIATREFKRFSRQGNVFDPHKNETYMGRESLYQLFELPFYDLVSDICRRSNFSRLSVFIAKKYFGLYAKTLFMNRNHFLSGNSLVNQINSNNLNVHNYLFNNRNYRKLKKKMDYSLIRISHDFFLIKHFLSRDRIQRRLTSSVIIRERRYALASYIKDTWRNYFSKFINFESTTTPGQVYYKTVRPTAVLPLQYFKQNQISDYFSKYLQYTKPRAADSYVWSTYSLGYNEHVQSKTNSKLATKLVVENRYPSFIQSIDVNSYNRTTLFVNGPLTFLKNYNVGFNFYYYCSTFLGLFLYFNKLKYNSFCVLELHIEDLAYIILKFLQQFYFFK